MILSLRTKLSLAFAAVALLSIFLISLMVNSLLERQFREYVEKKHEDKNMEIVSLISQQFVEKNRWRNEVIENIGLNAMQEGLIVKVKDLDGNIIWDAKEHNSGFCEQMINQISNNMLSRYPSWNGEFIASQYPIKYNLSEVGTIEIGHFGNYYFNEHELYFITTINNALIWVMVIALVFALFLSTQISKRISIPVGKVILTAKMIAEGNYSQRSEQESSTKEIRELTLAINHLAQSLETQEILRKRLTTDVAHELRTPMATLQSHMEAMIDGIWQPTNERLKSCHEEIIRINKMIGDLGKLVKYEGDISALHKSEFDIGELTATIAMNFESEFNQKGIQLIYNKVRESVNADRDKISQVLVNLISNALKYTSEGGKVELKIEATNDSVQFISKDTGQGISQEDLPYIFERFYRADKSRNRLTGGLGIGLTITKAVVEAHQGSIEVSSILNVGTEFIVTLPRL